MNRRCSGFTLVELMVVIIILGVLATVAINLTIRLQERTYVATLQSDLSSAYKAAVAFYADHPDDEITSAGDLEPYGYHPSNKVALNVVDGFEDTLLLQASHPGVNGDYKIDSTGKIIEP